MRLFFFILLPYSLLFSWDAEKVCRQFSMGRCDAFLGRVERDFQETLAAGGYDAFLGSQSVRLKPKIARLKESLERQKEVAALLNEVNGMESAALFQVAKRYPKRKSGKLAYSLALYAQAVSENPQAFQTMALIEIGGYPMPPGTVAFTLHEIFTEYGLKESFVNDALLEGSISTTKAEVFSFVLQLERNRKMREFCEKKRGDPVADFSLCCLECWDKTAYAAGDRKELSDLLSKVRMPEEEGEEEIKLVLEAMQRRRDVLLQKGYTGK